MALVIPKPQPMKPVDLTPQPPGLTRADVEAMLAARDALWERRLADMAAALQPKPAPPPAPVQPRKGASITFKTDPRGQIIGADIVPKT